MIIITGDYGQLGNRMIVFANMIAAARTHDLRVMNPAFAPYARHFTATAGDWLCRYPPRPRALFRGGGRTQRAAHYACDLARRYSKKIANRTGRWPLNLRVVNIGWDGVCDVDRPEFVRLARDHNLLARGWMFRARTSFERHADAIRSFFTPIESHRQHVAGVIRRARQDVDTLVGVHIRHGDYQNFLGGSFYYTADQYAAMMRHVLDLLPGQRVGFLVCSNVPQPPEAFPGLRVTFGPGHLIEDLYALAACDRLLAAPSTFSMWASFYGAVPLYVVPHAAPDFSLADFRVFTHLHECTSVYSPVPLAV